MAVTPLAITTATLQTLLTSGESNIKVIQDNVDNINSTQDKFTEFNENMEMFVKFEGLMGKRLTQLDDFLTNTDLAVEDENLTTLKNTVDGLKSAYEGKLKANNELANRVKTTYDTKSEQIRPLIEKSEGISAVTTTITNLISTHRNIPSSGYKANKTVLLIGDATPTSTQTLAPGAKITFAAPESITAKDGLFPLGYGLSLVSAATEDNRKIITYTGSADSVELFLNIELLSCAHKVFDTSSKFLVKSGTSSAELIATNIVKVTLYKTDTPSTPNTMSVEFDAISNADPKPTTSVSIKDIVISISQGTYVSPKDAVTTPTLMDIPSIA